MKKTTTPTKKKRFPKNNVHRKDGNTAFLLASLTSPEYDKGNILCIHECEGYNGDFIHFRPSRERTEG